MPNPIGDQPLPARSRLGYLLRMAWGGAACGFVAGTVLSAIAAYFAITFNDGLAIDFGRILIGGGCLSAVGLTWGAYLGLTDDV